MSLADYLNRRHGPSADTDEEIRDVLALEAQALEAAYQSVLVTEADRCPVCGKTVEEIGQEHVATFRKLYVG